MSKLLGLRLSTTKTPNGRCVQNSAYVGIHRDVAGLKQNPKHIDPGTLADHDARRERRFVFRQPYEESPNLSDNGDPIGISVQALLALLADARGKISSRRA
jgi:hypothetical protein